MNGNFCFVVRGYELDSLGHVNNSIYLNYYEHARWKQFKECGIYEYLLDNALHIIVTEVSVRYVAELKVFDEAIVKSYFSIKGNFIIADQSIVLVNDKKRISKSRIKHLLVNRARVVHEIPTYIRNIFSNYEKKEKVESNSIIS